MKKFFGLAITSSLSLVACSGGGVITPTQPKADLSLSVVSAPSTLISGNTTSIPIKITNTGSADANGLTVKLTLQSLIFNKSVTADWACNADTISTVTCTVADSLPRGSTDLELSFTAATVSTTTKGNLTAVVSTPSEESSTTNNTVNYGVNIVPAPYTISGAMIVPSSVTPLFIPSPPKAIAGRYIVTVQNSGSVQNLSLNHNGEQLGTKTVEVEANSLDEAKNFAGVIEAQPVYEYQKLAVVNDPYYQTPFDPSNANSNQWYLDHIGMPAAGDKLGSNSVSVAVLDDGYMVHSTDLPSSVWDVVPVASSCQYSTGYLNCLNTADNTNSPQYVGSGFSHGTAVAGVIAAQTNNNGGIAGVGWNKVKIVPINVFGSAGASTTSIAKGIKTAIAKNVKVINLSLCLNATNGHCSAAVDSAIDAAIQEATNAGITVVASAGNYNDAFVAYPANNTNVIAVGFTDINKKRAVLEGTIYGSNYGSGLDLVAPGKNVLTVSSPSSWVVENGSSFSSPMVAGTAALLYGKKPDATPNQIKNALLSSALSLGSNCQYGKGLVQMDKALDAISSAATTAPAEACTTSTTGKVEILNSSNQTLSTVSKPSDAFDDTRTMNYSFNIQGTGVYTLKASLFKTASPSEILATCQKVFTVSKTTTGVNLNVVAGNSSFPDCP